MKKSSQVTGNVGLYYVCNQLAKRGWNVMPTSRNAKGVDVIVYNHDASKRHTVQVKALTNKVPVPFGSSPDSLLMNDYLVICRGVYADKPPKVFIAKPVEIINKIHKGTNEEGQISYWFDRKEYERFAGRWEIINDEDGIVLEASSSSSDSLHPEDQTIS